MGDGGKSLWDGDEVRLPGSDNTSYRPDMAVDATGVGQVTHRCQLKGETTMELRKEGMEGLRPSGFEGLLRTWTPGFPGRTTGVRQGKDGWRKAGSLFSGYRITA